MEASSRPRRGSRGGHALCWRLDRLVPGGEDNLVAVEVKPYTGATCDRPSFRTMASLAVPSSFEEETFVLIEAHVLQ